jgi:hypothetical protein
MEPTLRNLIMRQALTAREHLYEVDRYKRFREFEQFGKLFSHINVGVTDRDTSDRIATRTLSMDEIYRVYLYLRDAGYADIEMPNGRKLMIVDLVGQKDLTDPNPGNLIAAEVIATESIPPELKEFMKGLAEKKEETGGDKNE